MSQAAREATSDELTLLRTPGDWSRAFLGIYKPNVIYTALLNGAPASTDMVGQISFDGGSGTLENVKAEMTLWVGSTAGARDLGTCRIRKAPIAGTIYIGYTSEIDWADNCHLTIVDHAILSKKPVLVSAGDILMDGEHSFDDQHVDFDPVPVLSCHAVGSLVDGEISFQWDASDSWVFDSTITGYAWVAPGASASSGMSTATPTITYDTAGNHPVYCTVTAANGKSAVGVRFTMRFDAEHPAHRAEIQDPSVDYDNGGWSFNARMFADADPTEIIEGALCILFSEDWYGSTKQSLGQMENRENIICWGYIADESIDWNAEASSVEFTIQGPHEWLKKINANPFAISMAVNTPDTWEVMPALTVDRALWHVLHWRSNATALINFVPSGNTLYAPKLEAMDSSLWNQMQDMAWSKIFGRLGCNRYGTLYAVVDPQLVPVEERTWETVMTLTKKDWRERVDVTRNKQRKLAMLNLSGWIVDLSASVSAVYALAMGHVYAQYGGSDIIDKVLVESQTKLNTLAGLYMGWKNKELEFEFVMPQNNRMIDLWPNQYLETSLAAGDTTRGIAYAGKLIPRSITLRRDAEAGTWSTDINCEQETFAELAVNGDIPEDTGMDDLDLSFPPMPDFPSLPDLGPIVYQDPTATNANHPKKVVIASSKGVFYTEDFDTELTDETPGPTWKAMNNGLDSFDRADIAEMVVTPSGAIYLLTNGCDKIFVADGLGATWRVLFRSSQYPQTGSYIFGIGVNPTKSDEIGIWGGRTWSWPYDGNIGQSLLSLGNRSGVSIISGSAQDWMRHNEAAVLYVNGGWTVFHSNGTGILGSYASPCVTRYSANGTIETAAIIDFNPGQGGANRHAVSAGTQNKAFQWDEGGYAGYAEVVGVSATWKTGIDMAGYQGMAFSPTGTHAMGQNAGGTPYKTTDGGATWDSVSGFIAVGSDVWENCRDNNRWIYGGGATIKFTGDQGASVPSSKEGNLPYIAALLDITCIRYIS